MTHPSTAPAAARFIACYHDDAAAVRDELAAGLRAPQASVSPKFLYDTLGSRLFEAITELPEYTATRTEAAIVAQHRVAIAQRLGMGHTLVDLGAGNCEKAAGWFGLLQPSRYVAVDIAAAFLERSVQALQRRFPGIDMLGVSMDFSSRLALPGEVGSSARTLLFPGSSIGNFTPNQAWSFLCQAREAAQGGSLLIGVDLLKPAAQLEPAYDDALGVTAAFNRNLLRNVNRLLGADFALGDWAHAAHFNAGESRIEMHLRALRSVTVTWPGGARHFDAGDTIHTENSCKYDTGSFAALLRDAGFVRTECWTDAQRGFAVFVASGG